MLSPRLSLISVQKIQLDFAFSWSLFICISLCKSAEFYFLEYYPFYGVIQTLSVFCARISSIHWAIPWQRHRVPLTFFVSVCYRPTPSSPWSWVWTWRTSPPVRSWWFPRSPPGHSTTRSRSGCTTPRAGCWSYSSRSSPGRGDPCRLVSVSKLKVDNI